MVLLYGKAMVLVSLFALAGILAGLLLHRIISSYLEGAISGTVCLAIVGVYAGAIILAITAPTMQTAVVILILIALTAILTPLVKIKLASKDLKSLHDENICRYRELVESNPENLAAHSMLAKELYSSGRIDEAIGILEGLVERNPSDYGDARFLHKLTRERDERNS